LTGTAINSLGAMFGYKPSTFERAIERARKVVNKVLVQKNSTKPRPKIVPGVVERLGYVALMLDSTSIKKFIDLVIILKLNLGGTKKKWNICLQKRRY
jgi:hypothetical protein